MDIPSGPLLVRSMRGTVFYEDRGAAEYVAEREKSRNGRVVVFVRETEVTATTRPAQCPAPPPGRRE